jgi:hypothetical protein
MDRYRERRFIEDMNKHRDPSGRAGVYALTNPREL